MGGTRVFRVVAVGALVAWAVVALSGCRRVPLARGAGGDDPGGDHLPAIARRGADAGADATVATDAAGEGPQGLCPAADDGSPLPGPPDPRAARVPTRVPFSCDPLPRAFIFPDVRPDSPPDVTPDFPANLTSTPAVYARCASFAPRATSAVALSPDGRFAALVNGDGIARVVDVSSHQVVGALAPPRAAVTLAAFSPAGDTLLTVAGGEHQVTLWRTGDWSPIWTTTLPGHTYQYVDGRAGGIAFSPDGRSIALSPGTGLFLLDAASGGLRATGPADPILDVAYAWGGRRVVAASALLTGHCVKNALGGAIQVLAPDTLAALRTIKSWGGYSLDIVVPAFRASPADDLVFTPASTLDADPSVKAFRLSDGAALPPTGMAALPIAFMPGGATLLEAADGELRVVRLADGAIVARTTAAAATSLKARYAVSADGAAVALGAPSPDLLSLWNPGGNDMAAVCTASGPDPGPLVLSGDGRLVAQAAGTSIQIMRPDDGAVVATVSGGCDPVSAMTLSRTGRYLVAQLGTGISAAAFLWSLPDGAMLADLSRAAGDGYWGNFAFSPGERSLYTLWVPHDAQSEERTRLALPAAATVSGQTISSFETIAGFSAGCPVIFDQQRGVARTCDMCQESPPIPAAYAAFGLGAAVSPDGRFVATHDGWAAGSTTLWSMPPDARPLRVFPRRADESPPPLEIPYAVTIGGARVLTGAQPDNPACYDGPGFALRLRDSATGAVVDQLPPGPTSLADGAARVAYDGQIWCAPASP